MRSGKTQRLQQLAIVMRSGMTRRVGELDMRRDKERKRKRGEGGAAKSSGKQHQTHTKLRATMHIMGTGSPSRQAGNALDRAQSDWGLPCCKTMLGGKRQGKQTRAQQGCHLRILTLFQVISLQTQSWKAKQTSKPSNPRCTSATDLHEIWCPERPHLKLKRQGE
jgi:hypothetical protein